MATSPISGKTTDQLLDEALEAGANVKDILAATKNQPGGLPVVDVQEPTAQDIPYGQEFDAPSAPPAFDESLLFDSPPAFDESLLFDEEEMGQTEKTFGDHTKSKVTRYHTIDDYINVLREFASGGIFADELEATVRSGIDRLPTEADALAEQFGGKKNYRDAAEIHSEISRERKDFAAANGGLVLGLNLTGALLTGAPLATYVGLGASVPSAVLRQAGAGAIEGTLFGYASGNTIEEREDLALLGGVLGAPLGALAGWIGGVTNPRIRDAVAREAIDAMPDDGIAQGFRDFVGETVYRMKHTGGDETTVPSLQSMMIRHSAESGIPLQRLEKVVDNFGGLDEFDYTGLDVDDLRELFQVSVVDDLPPAYNMNTKLGQLMRGFDEIAAPVKRVLVNAVGEKFANRINRSLNRSMIEVADYSQHTDKLMGATNKQGVKLAEWLDQPTEKARKVKARMLDYALDGDRHDYQSIRMTIAREFGEGTAKQLDSWYALNEGWQTRYYLGLNRTHPITKGWIHTQKKGEVEKVIIRPKTPNTATDQSAKQRSRQKIYGKDGWEADVDNYENPLASMLNWVHDEAPVINTAEMLHLNPRGRIFEFEEGDILPRGIVERLSARDAKVYEEQGLTDALLKKLQMAERAETRKSQTAGVLAPALREMFEAAGKSPQDANSAIEVMQSVLVNSRTAPNDFVRILRNAGYSTTIMNPYGAAMNLHDTFISMSADGIVNGLSAMVGNAMRKGGRELSTDSMGIHKQVMGEYVRGLQALDDTGWRNWTIATEKLMEKSAAYSGFASLDRMGKNQIARTALESVRSTIGKGSKGIARFKEQWGNTFSPAELDQIIRDVGDGKASPLVKELAMFRLSEIQPINALSIPKAALDHPNLRVAYMLKNFAVRQLDFLRKEGLKKLINGKSARERMQGASFLVRYSLIGGLGYNVVQEGRQPLAGREIGSAMEDRGPIGRVAVQPANVLTFGGYGVTDAQIERTYRNPVQEITSGLLPPFIVVEAPLKDASALLRGEPQEATEVLKNLPVVGKTFFKPLLDD